MLLKLSNLCCCWLQGFGFICLVILVGLFSFVCLLDVQSVGSCYLTSWVSVYLSYLYWMVEGILGDCLLDIALFVHWTKFVWLKLTNKIVYNVGKVQNYRYKIQSSWLWAINLPNSLCLLEIEWSRTSALCLTGVQ